jgi:hypothetical protein
MLRILIPALFIFCSCAGMDSRDLDKTVSENTVLKRKVTLLERENSVIRRENNDTASLLKKSDASLEKTESDFSAFKIKYAEETKLLNNKYDNYKKRSELQIKENDGRIKLLTEQNSLLEKTLTERVKTLSEEIRKNTEKFNAEREKMKKDFAKSESEFLKKLEGEHSIAEARDKEISELKQSVAALTEKIKNISVPTPKPETSTAPAASPSPAPSAAPQKE